MKKFIFLLLLNSVINFIFVRQSYTKNIYSEISIGVLDFKVKNLLPDEAMDVTSSFSREIAKIRNVSVIYGIDLYNKLKEHNITHIDIENKKSIVKIGKLLKLDYAIIGFACRTDTMFILTVRIFNIKKEEYIAESKNLNSTNIDDFIKKVVPEIAEEVEKLINQQKSK